ncbi:peptidase U62 modulator of DNA gyrase [Sulfolobus acidocaldarius SUSAZ]|nr:peptidase U62 modulator of DNA gyrase [Sulfolobus acidocaldarius SUSAZ]
MLSNLLKRFSSFKYVELRKQRNSHSQIIILNGSPVGYIKSVNEGYSVRVFDENYLYFSSSDKPEHLTASKLKVKGWEKGISEESREAGKYEVTQKINLLDIPVQDKMKELSELAKSIYSLDLRSKIVSSTIYYMDSIEDKEIVFEDGTEINSKIPRVRLFYSITLTYENRSATIFSEAVGGSGGYELIKEKDPYGHLENKLKSVDNVLVKGKSVTPGRKDVVFSNELSGIMAHESVGHPFEADRILGRESAQAGLSYLVGRKIGERIGSEAVNVMDNPLVDGGLGYYKIDDEGVKARPKHLIKNGIINELLQDRFSANKFGVQSNGSARASAFNREPLVRMSNTYFKPGDYSFQELIEDIKDGIYFKSYMEWNIDDLRIGQRYVGLETYEIRNGEIGEPVLFPVFEGRTFDVLMSIDAVDKSLEFFGGTCGKGDPDQGIPVWLGGPNMRIRNVVIKVRGNE